jgi:hypothetical protein
MEDLRDPFEDFIKCQCQELKKTMGNLNDENDWPSSR